MIELETIELETEMISFASLIMICLNIKSIVYKNCLFCYSISIKQVTCKSYNIELLKGIMYDVKGYTIYVN